MPGKVDEKLWDRAKASAKKSHPDWDEKNPRLWKVISAIYKKMGGKFSKEMEKSLAQIESIERMAPSFIEDPRVWLGAIKKSCGSYKWEAIQFPGILKAYTEMGGKVSESSMLETSFGANIAKSIGDQFDGQAEDLEKGKAGSFATTHKYAERVQKPGGGWRYVYGKGDNKRAGGQTAEGSGHGYKKVPKRPGAMGVVPEGQATAKTSMAIIAEKLAKKDASAQKASLQNVSDESLAAIHAHAQEKGHKGLAAIAGQMRAERKVKAATASKNVKKSQDEFDSFYETYREDIKKSLVESHPDWDAETLERRLEPQIRQMFRLYGE